MYCIHPRRDNRPPEPSLAPVGYKKNKNDQSSYSFANTMPLPEASIDPFFSRHVFFALE